MTPLAAGMAVGAARRLVTEALRDAAIESPEADARILVGHALGLDHGGVAAAAPRPLSTSEAAALAALMARRLAHEPVARIVGRREFWSLPLDITPATLLPRPDSETVVEAALAAVDAGHGRTAVRRVADLGTGSGALLLALISELPRAYGVGTDISAAALSTARHNARRLDLDGRAGFVASDFAAPLAGEFELIVSNPPYVASEAISTLAPEVRDYDPRTALDGGADGLAAYRCIAIEASAALAPGGLLVLEMGVEQSADVTAILRRGGYTVVRVHDDLAGIPRAVVARRE